jgi:hypothetical protein
MTLLFSCDAMRCDVMRSEFLAHFAGPLLRDVLDEIDAVVASRLAAPLAQSHRPQVTIFSGHDVNLLGMLFALNAVMDDNHWPSYGGCNALWPPNKSRVYAWPPNKSRDYINVFLVWCGAW